MNRTTMLRKIMTAMHRGRPVMPNDVTWDRAVGYAERLLADSVKEESAIKQLHAILDRMNGTVTICRSVQPPSYHVVHRSWTSGGESIVEARGNSLEECFELIENTAKCLPI